MKFPRSAIPGSRLASFASVSRSRSAPTLSPHKPAAAIGYEESTVAIRNRATISSDYDRRLPPLPISIMTYGGDPSINSK